MINHEIILHITLNSNILIIQILNVYCQNEYFIDLLCNYDNNSNNNNILGLLSFISIEIHS